MLPALGWFEGGGYYNGGLFRPNYQSMMRHSATHFNAPSIAALDDEMCQRLGFCGIEEGLHNGIWWLPSESGWGLFVFDQGSNLAVAWFTYDDDGEPTWFLMPAEKLEPGVYQGDVLRFTGVPFNEIEGPAATSDSVIGQALLQFADNGELDFSYSVDGASRSVTLEPFGFPDGALRCEPAESAPVATTVAIATRSS